MGASRTTAGPESGRGSHGTRLSVTPTPIRDVLPAANILRRRPVSMGKEERGGSGRRTRAASPARRSAPTNRAVTTLPAGSEPDTPSNVVDSLLRCIVELNARHILSMASKRARPCTRGPCSIPHALHTSYRRRVSAVTSDGLERQAALTHCRPDSKGPRPKARWKRRTDPHLVDVLNWRSLSAFSCPKPGQSGGEPSQYCFWAAIAHGEAARYAEAGKRRRQKKKKKKKKKKPTAIAIMSLALGIGADC